ncbi:SEC-C metal-binding domain-containing protein [Paenibacillus filicis]|uniref:SEC-C metal-binding domain-containing protein n=1 Tax=Paenibacillus filicis TaxID=669464 RepID=A0ABU9DNF5_9BACL
MLKIGRNEPCYCGSGAKYKRCCLNKIEVTALAAPGHNDIQARTAEPQAELGLTPAPAPTIEEIRRIADTEIQWETDAYAALASELISRMEDSYEPTHIGEALSVWDKFSRENRPSFKKSGAFCAALEYMVVQAHGLPVTQSDLAAKYEVSSSTLSKRYQELLQFADSYFGSHIEEPASVPASLPSSQAAEGNIRLEDHARDSLLASYLEQDRLDEAEQLLQAFPDDSSVTFVYDQLLLAYKKSGTITPEIDALYRQAHEQNEHVLEFLFGGKPLPKPGSGTTSSEAEEEAVVYVTTHIRLWIKLPELLVWIYKQLR